MACEKCGEHCKDEVLRKRQRMPPGCCCDRNADQMACSCYENASPCKTRRKAELTAEEILDRADEVIAIIRKSLKRNPPRG